MGTIEFHGWDSHVEALEKPDRMVFDLDPDEGLDFADVKKSALDIRRQLADIGLVSFAMLSGCKGVHVVVPVDPRSEEHTSELESLMRNSNADFCLKKYS